MSSKRYTDEYKAEAVKQVLDRGHTVCDVALRLGLNKHSLYEWVKRAKVAVPTGQQAAPMAVDRADSKEVRQLRAELKRMTEERTAAYFAKG
jgi:transposase